MARSTPTAIGLRYSREVLEQIVLLQQAAEKADPSSSVRAHLLSTRDHLASLLPRYGEKHRPSLEDGAAARELSGPAWVSRFPGSAAIADCAEPFRSNLTAFLAALSAASARVGIASTFRPPERAFLMHWSWKIARNIVDPRDADTMPGVAIDWVHRDATGNPDIPRSRSTASQMVGLYGIVAHPALTSRHTERRAVDMDIAWEGTLSVLRADGSATHIANEPRSGMNPQLIAVGATYGVIKARFAGDPPHWSDDGH
jgi:hypothetical protein